MIMFWLVCAVFILIALAFILPTALQQRNEKSLRAIADERKLANIAIYRDQLSELESDLQNGVVSQEQYAQDREEIERRLLEDTSTAGAAETGKTAKTPPASRSTAYALAFALPLAAVIFYLQIGNVKSITDPTGGVRPVASTGGERTQEQIEANVAALAKRLQSNPSDVQGWIMLAQSYRSMQRYGEAAGAYAKATELQPNNADLWADYAFVSALASDQRMEGKPMELVNQALKVDPENLAALQLAGLGAFQMKDYAKAVQYWEKVLTKVPADSEIGRGLRERVNEAKTLAGSK